MVHVIADSKLIHYCGDGVTGTFQTLAKLLSRVAYKFPFDELKVYIMTDIGKSEYRSKLLPSYKSGRSYGDPEAYQQFKHTYIEGVIPAAKLLGVSVIDVEGVEADDQASILAHQLPEEDHKVLVTNDKDWYQTVLTVSNAILLQPLDFQFVSPTEIFIVHDIETYDQFIATKCILGDRGDAIRPAATQCGAACFQRFREAHYIREYTLDDYKEKYIGFLGGAPKHKVHTDYLAVGITTIPDAWDLNVLLGKTMTDYSKLKEHQATSLQYKYAQQPAMGSVKEITEVIRKVEPNETNVFGGPLEFPDDLYKFYKELHDQHKGNKW